MTPDTIVIDLSTKKTEYEWLETCDRFWLAAVPKMFEWIRWILALAALSYVAHKGPVPILKYIVGVANVFMMFYYFAYFAKFDFRSIPFLKGPRFERTTSIIFSSAIAAITHYIIVSATTALVSSHQ